MKLLKISHMFPLAITALLAVSCGDPEQGDNADKVTYYQDIAPIYAEKCVQCHHEGGIAPFALDNFEDASTFAAAAKVATKTRQMPPYLVVADGSCGEFEAPRTLTSDEIELIGRWADDHTPEGKKIDIPKPRELPTLGDDAIELSTPDFVPVIVGDAVSQFDEYRCFLVDPKIEEDTFLTGYDVVPGNTSIVHHVLAFPVDLDAMAETYDGQTNAEVIAALDVESPDREGWPCFGVAGDGVAVQGIPVTWAPGMGAVRYPHGAGVQMAAGTKVVIQVHYNLVDEKVRGQADSTTLKLLTSNQVERLGFFDLPDQLLRSLFDEDPYLIPPGEKSHKYQFEVDYDDVIAETGVLDISGVMPHMHERGRKLSFEIIRGKEEMCRAQVNNWDFNWQLFYFYEEPLRLELGDKLRITCDYNTEGLTEPVYPGWGTQNEMCLTVLLLSVPLVEK